MGGGLVVHIIEDEVEGGCVGGWSGGRNEGFREAQRSIGSDQAEWARPQEERGEQIWARVI